MKWLLHKVLAGEGAEKYLPFALSQIREFERLGGYRSQQFNIEDFNIWCLQKPPFQYIYITGGDSAYFEFQTSGKPVETGEIAGTTGPFPAYKVATVGVELTFKGTGVKVSPSIGKNLKQINATTESRLGRPAQAALIDEPVSYPTTDYKTQLYESFAPNHPHTGIMLRAWNQEFAATSPPQTVVGSPQTNRGPVGSFVFRDVDFDIPFQYGKGKVTRGIIRGEADWPRANAIRTVKNDRFGNRDFGIYNDVFGNFMVFPLSAIGEENGYEQNITERLIKTVRPEFPAWCYVPTETARVLYQTYGFANAPAYPELDWKFHPDGTKACSIVYEREPAVYDSTYFGSSIGVAQFTQADFDAYRDFRAGITLRQRVSYPTTDLPTHYNAAPGIIEVTIGITLSGPNPEDFSVAIDLTEIRRPTTSEYCPFLVGYCYQDIPVIPATNPITYQARKGDMVCLDIERYYVTANPFFGTAFTWSMLVLKNLTRATELRAFWGTGHDGTRNWSCHLVDYDLPTLSFALRVECSTSVNTTLPLTPASMGYPGTTNVPLVTQHFGINVFTLNQQREVIYPETIDATARTAIEAVKATSGRAVFALVPSRTYIRLPLNDLRDWSDLPDLRDYLSQQAGFKSGSTSPPSAALATWYGVGIQPYLQNSLAPTYVTVPRFSWYAYSDEIMNHCHLTLHSTFFAHPNGSWAFYDQSMVYNKNGMDLTNAETYVADTLTSFDASKLEHCIFDRVHFQRTKKNVTATRDTTFRELYNTAAAKVRELETPPDLQDIALTDLRVTFTKQQAAISGPHAVTWLDLKAEWFGVTGYYRDGAYVKATTTVPQNPSSDAGGLFDLNLGSIFNDAPASLGNVFYFQDTARPIKFSSCVYV